MIVTFDHLPELRRDLDGQSVVFRGGCYDIVHEGHIQGLEFAKQQGDILVVGVRPDARVSERKGPLRPIRPELARLIVIDALGSVDYSFIMPPGNEEIGPATLRVINALRPNVFVASRQQDGGVHPNDERIRDMGTEICFDPTQTAQSTTAIIDTILARYRGINED